MSFDHHDDLASFGQRVKSYRILRGLTQSELADHVNLDRKTVNRLESGQYSTSLRNVFRIAAALNIVPDSLFTRHGDEDALPADADDGPVTSPRTA